MTQSWKQLAQYNCEAVIAGNLRCQQEQWLLECVRRNQQTVYGKRYDFGKICMADQYQEAVPIVEYQDITDLIDAISNGTANCLFAGEAIAFEKTSGSTGSQKLIPYSPYSIMDFRRTIIPWLAGVADQYQIRVGSAYWAISPATRLPEFTAAGIPVGLSDAAYLGDELIPFFLGSSAVPPWVAEIANVKEWQLVTLYSLVCCQNLQLISVWSPTFLLALLDALDEQRQELEALLEGGGMIAGHQISANAAAYANLQLYYKRKAWAVLWPELKVISCWADASAKTYAEQLMLRFPGIPVQPKGLLLTEGVVTVPNRNNHPVLAASSGFYEFIDNQNRVRLAHELDAGERYIVVITTAGGLYRYNTRDRVLCEGYAGDLPVLRFIGREVTSDLVGEKLTEEFVTTCLAVVSGFRMLLPVVGKIPGYYLIVEDGKNAEEILDKVEHRLCSNPQYAYARKLGQLRPLQRLQIKNPLDLYLKSPIHEKTRLGDIKVPALCLDSRIFNEHLGVAA